MRPVARSRLVAAVFTLVAAFLTATYYLFVLAVSPGTRPSAVLFYPFLGGALAYLAWIATRGEGRRLVGVFADPSAYLTVALLLSMQLAVLAATFLIGPVDASLLSLLGDVVATPLVVAALISLQRSELRTPTFVAGLALSLTGGALAIAGGHALGTVRSAGWLVVPAIPACLAFYVVLCARSGARHPVSVVVAQSVLGAAAGALVLAPLVPGGVHGVLAVQPGPLALLLVNGVVTFCVAPLLYFRAIERAGLLLPPMLMSGIPIFTLLLCALVLGIAPAALAILGVPVAAVGGILALASGAAAATEKGPAGPAGGLTASR